MSKVEKSIETLYGTFDDEQLRNLKLIIDGLVELLNRIENLKTQVKESIDSVNDETKIPKKIIRKMAMVKYKETYETLVSENEEFQSLFEILNELD